MSLSCEVFLTANAGVLASFGGVHAAFDALHDRPAAGWSALTPELTARVWRAFGPAGPDLVCVTHTHPDHYAPALWEEAHRRWPKALFVGPVADGETRMPGTEGLTFSVSGARLEVCPLPHEGAEYAQVPHFGCLLTAAGRTLLFPGDCAVASPALADWLDGRQPDVAVLNFPWLTLTRGRVFVESVLRPGHVLLCHLPFEADDTEGYRTAALKAAARSRVPDVRCLLAPLEPERIFLP